MEVPSCNIERPTYALPRDDYRPIHPEISGRISTVFPVERVFLTGERKMLLISGGLIGIWDTLGICDRSTHVVFSRGPSPSGRGCREAAGEGKRSTLIRPFRGPSPRGSVAGLGRNIQC